MSPDPDNSNRYKLQIEEFEFVGGGGTYKKYIYFDRKTGVVLKEKDVSVIDGEEVECIESDLKKYQMRIPSNPENRHNLELFNTKTGELLENYDKGEELDVLPGISVMVTETDLNIWKAALAPIENFNNEEKEKAKQSIEKEMKENNSELSIEKVTETIELILSQECIPNTFYKHTDGKEAFNVSRIIADRFSGLHALLDDLTLNQVSETSYMVEAESKDSRGNSIKLEHRLQASSFEEAKTIGQIIIKKLQGMLIKTWLSCWKIANEKGRYTFTCPLTEIMYRCNPGRDRKVYFNKQEKIDFYENLRDLENTKFVFTKTYKKKGVEKYESFEIRVLEIHRRVGEKDEAPSDITMTILNTAALQNEKTTFIGVPVKNKTLELHSDDTSLATWIQIRKNQVKNHSTLKLDREFLINLAGLSRTNNSNKTRANKLLMSKLVRLVEKDIILECPPKINDIVCLKIR